MKFKLEIKVALIQQARQKYGEISYCGATTCWAECFTFTPDPDEIHFWFNDSDGNTHVITEAYNPNGKTLK